MSTILPFYRVEVTRDVSRLRAAAGYWSGKQVAYNPDDRIVVLDQTLDASKIRAIAQQAYADNLRNAVAKRFDQCLKLADNNIAKMLTSGPMFRNAFSPQKLAAFQGAEFRGSYWRVTWIRIAEWLEATYPDDFERQRQFLIDEITTSMVNGDGALQRVHRLSISWLHLGLPTFTALLDAFSTCDEALDSLSAIRQFTWNYQQQKRDRAWALHHNAEVLGYLRRYDLPFAEMRNPDDAQYALGIANAADLLLTLLAHEHHIFLPSSWTFLVAPCRLVAPAWPWNELITTQQQLLQAIICCSSVRQIPDLPSNVKAWLEGIKFHQTAHGLFKRIIADYQRANPGLPPWPLANLHGTKQKVQLPFAGMWGPEAIGRTHGASWGRFAEIFVASSDASMRYLESAFRHLLPWVSQRGFANPADITVRDLNDPFDPARPDTFRRFLEQQSAGMETSLSAAWTGAARSFDVVVNALKIRPDPLLPLRESPFVPLENPFRASRPGKTTRRRLPTAIHDAMIEVLLDPDEEGRPTYAWAKDNVCGSDWFDWYPPGSEARERVWCPSRCAMLAFLLMIPIRGKQAGWLDRGLMDERIWDIAHGRYVDNTHPLRGWRYSDGETQLQRYGRPTGVLQPLSDAFMETEELGIFISTNKTQMWDPANRRGYEMPWPSVPDDSNSGEASEIARWLNRPYMVLFDQLEWMNRYCPDPTPVTMMDSAVERRSVHEKYADRIPAFAPVFADLSQDYYRPDERHTLYYLPVKHPKIYRLFHAITVETERRLAAEGRKVVLTQESDTGSGHGGRVSLFEIHGLRVAGISRLIEMGVPVGIVQEFIAGHATAVMTQYYNKGERGVFKAKLVDAWAKNGIVDNWDSLREPMATRESIWVFNRRHAQHREDGLMLQYSGWRTVPGGICPLGGTSCHIGSPTEEEDLDRSATGEYGPVQGGCGNCRFFTTGPAFLIQQGQAMNELMLELRLHGRSRNALQEALSELGWADVPGLSADQRKKLVFDRQVIREQIASLDQKVEPLILEWFNRYRMYEESGRLLGEWRDFHGLHGGQKPENALALVSGSAADELCREIEVKLEKSGDFDLVRNILDAAKIQGGLAKASTLSKERCAEFMDRILRVENSRHLLIDIRDERARHEAAYLMACMAEHLVGGAAVQAALDSNTPLPLGHEKHEEFQAWVNTVLTEAASSRRTPGRLTPNGDAIVMALEK